LKISVKTQEEYQRTKGINLLYTQKKHL
jgi:hypothetical protein